MLYNNRLLSGVRYTYVEVRGEEREKERERGSQTDRVTVDYVFKT